MRTTVMGSDGVGWFYYPFGRDDPTGRSYCQMSIYLLDDRGPDVVLNLLYDSITET